MEDAIYTIGHSTHPEEHFVGLLLSHGITAISDVRSKPYSRVNPQYNREELKQTLRIHGISYVFLGKELGARSDDPSCYEYGKVQYDRLAQTQLFQSGIERILIGKKKHRIALMCAEKEPLHCHRTILVTRHLVAAGGKVQHIHANGELESQEEVLRRLMLQLGMPETDMFKSRTDLEREAYERQEQRISYRVEPTEAADPHFEKPLAV